MITGSSCGLGQRPLISPQGLIERPGGRPVAVNVSVHPGRLSGARTCTSCGPPVMPVRALGACRSGRPCTFQVTLSVTSVRPVPLTVTAAVPETGAAGAVPLITPVTGSMARPAGRPVAV